MKIDIDIKDFENKLKVALPPALVSTIILFINLYFFGLSNIIIAPYMTLTFIRLKSNASIEKNIIKPLVIHLFIGFLASIASEGIYSAFFINLFSVGILAYFLTDEYDPSSYFPYLMAFVFLQIFPTSFDKIPMRLLSIIIAYLVVIIALMIFAPKGVTAKITNLIENGFDNISLQLQNILDGKENNIENETFDLFETCKELNRLVYLSGKKKYYLFIIVFQHMNNVIDDLVDIKGLLDNDNNKNYILKLSKLFEDFSNYQSSDIKKEEYIGLIKEFIANNTLKDNHSNYYMDYILNRLISAIKDTTAPNKFDFKKYLNFRASKEYFKRYSRYTFSLNEFKIRFAIRISVLLAISFTVIRAFNIPKGYWIPMTIFLLTMPFYEDSKKRVSLRFKGTVIGLFASFILFSIFTTHFSHIIILVICTVFMYAFNDYGTKTIYITCYALSITTISMGDNEAIFLRLVYTCISAGIVLFANNFILPNKNHIELISMINRLIKLDEIIIDKIRSIIDLNVNKEKVKEDIKYIIYSSYLISGKLQLHFSKVNNIYFKSLLAKNNQLTSLLTHCCIVLLSENKKYIDKIYINECLININRILDSMKINTSSLKTILRYNCCINVNNLNHKNNYTNILLLKSLQKTDEVFEEFINLKNDL